MSALTALRGAFGGNRRPLIMAAVLALIAGVTVVIRTVGDGDEDSTSVEAVADSLATVGTTSTSTTPPSTSTSTTVAPSTTTRAPRATPTTIAPPVVEPQAPQPAPPPAPGPVPPTGGLTPYAGLGTWVDAFDFDPAHSGGNPSVTPSDVGGMAAAGVHTLYIQAARSDDPAAPGDLMAPELLGQFLTEAHVHGMQVVAWFLPKHADVADDNRHLTAIANFTAGGAGFDGIALDIEWRVGTTDHHLRSARLVETSQHLRSISGGRPVGAIVMPPVVTDVLNTSFWPDYPWQAMKPFYDVWLPMDYWTNRPADSPYRNAAHYTAENIRLLRQHIGSDEPVHMVGGIGNAATADDYGGFVQAAADAGTIGWSVYDWATTSSAAWPILAR